MLLVYNRRVDVQASAWKFPKSEETRSTVVRSVLVRGTDIQDVHCVHVHMLTEPVEVQPFFHFSPRTSFCTASISNLNLYIRHAQNRRRGGMRQHIRVGGYYGHRHADCNDAKYIRHS